MMLRSLATSSLVLAAGSLLGACAPGDDGGGLTTATTQAALSTPNGMAFNGMAFNGMAFNGMSFNGRAFNGRAFNGRAFNGSGFEVVGLNGLHLSSYVLEAHQSELTLVSYDARRRYKLDRFGGSVTLSATEPTTGALLSVRIQGPTTLVEADAVTRKPVLTYYLEFRDETSGAWVPGYTNEAGDPLWVIPLNGLWNSAPEDIGTPIGGSYEDIPDAITFAARGYALAKCVELGYRPWDPQLQDLHQTCVRALRADYCGDGRSFTRDGTLIDIWDLLRVQRRDTDPPPGAPARAWAFEARWNPSGAVCLADERIQDWAAGEEPTPSCFGVPLREKYTASCAARFSSASRREWDDCLIRTEFVGWASAN